MKYRVHILLFLVLPCLIVTCYVSEIPIPGDSPTNTPVAWSGDTKLTSPDMQPGDNFGYDVSISGDYAIISAAGDNDNGTGSGAAYIYYRTNGTWTVRQKLTPVDGEAGDHFGFPVDISGDYAIIGACDDDDNGTGSGAAYIYYRTNGTWTVQQKLTPVDGEAGDHFGCGVSISGNYAVVGACHDDDNGTDSGAAYIYYRTNGTWTVQQKLTPVDGEAGDVFGQSVGITSITKDVPLIIIGAPCDHENDSGKAYIFAWTGVTWIEWKDLTPADAAAGDQFGKYVDINESYAIVSAPKNDDNGTDSGSAYIYYCEDPLVSPVFTQQQKLSANDGAADDGYGTVSISPDYAVVGSQYDDDNGTNSGSVYIYQRIGTEWTEQQKLTKIDCTANDRFGYSVSISLNYILVGVFRDNDNVEDSGSVYIYKH